MKRVPRAALALVGVLALALTGCTSWSRASVAAQVGDTTISVSSVDQLASGIMAAYKTAGNPIDPTVAPKAAVQGLVIGALLNQASDKGESIVPASAITSMTQVDPNLSDATQKAQAEALATLVKAITAIPSGTDWLRGELAIGQAQNSPDAATALTSLAKSVPVAINPRFGTWDSAQGGFVNETGSLSTPAPTPTPAS